MTTPKTPLITWRVPFSKAEHGERLAAAEKQLVDATNGLGGDLQVHVDDTIYHVRLARVVPGQALWGMCEGAWGMAPPCEPPRAVLAMPVVRLPPATRFLAYDPSAATRIDGIEAGIIAFVLGTGDTKAEAYAAACKYLGVGVDGLAFGTTQDPAVEQGKTARRRGYTGSLFVA